MASRMKGIMKRFVNTGTAVLGPAGTAIAMLPTAGQKGAAAVVLTAQLALMWGVWFAGHRARRVVTEVQRNPALSLPEALVRMTAFGADDVEATEAEVRRMVSDLADAISPEAVAPILRVFTARSHDRLTRAEALSLVGALRGLHAHELDALRLLVTEALNATDAAVIGLAVRGNDMEEEVPHTSVYTPGGQVPITHCAVSQRLFRTLEANNIGYDPPVSQAWGAFVTSAATGAKVPQPTQRLEFTRRFAELIRDGLE
jgi:hypothetical protein